MMTRCTSCPRFARALASSVATTPLPPIDASRRNVLQPTSATGSSGPQVVARQQGEAYRRGLEREATRLGVRENLVFRDQFVTTEEVCRYLQAADIFITPYHNEAQVTSGALSYAMGAGAAIVSTPYWHAVLGITLILITVIFPQGIVGTLRQWRRRRETEP